MPTPKELLLQDLKSLKLFKEMIEESALTLRASILGINAIVEKANGMIWTACNLGVITYDEAEDLLIEGD